MMEPTLPTIAKKSDGIAPLPSEGRPGDPAAQRSRSDPPIRLDAEKKYTWPILLRWWKPDTIRFAVSQ